MQRKLLLLVFLVVFAFGLLLPKYAFAQTSGEGLTISPPLVEFEGKAGETYQKTIKITNPTDNLIEVYPKAMNFKAAGEGGEPAFYPDEEEGSKFSLAKWISFSQSKIAIMGDQVVEFNYTVSVPENAEPGGHYGVIFFATDPPTSDNSSNQISISSMIGSLVLVRTPGAIIEKGFLEKYFSNRVYFKLPAVFKIKIANLGNIHFKPKGEITIKDTFGHEVEKVAINQGSGNVLPDSSRLFEEKWQPEKMKAGRFTAKLRLVYGQTEKTLDGQLVFWVIPYWLIASALGVIALIVLAVVLLVRRKKSYY